MLEISDLVQNTLSLHMKVFGLEILFCQSKLVSWGSGDDFRCVSTLTGSGDDLGHGP